MSLATRCPTCATTFRVAQDQLKASEGWVRCGRCETVFNAVEGLFDLERDAPQEVDVPLASEAAAAATVAGAAAVEARQDGVDEDDRVVDVALDDVDVDQRPSSLGELLADPIDAHLFGPRKRTEAPPKPAGPLAPRDRGDFSDARFDSDLFVDNAAEAEGESLAAPFTDAAALPLESEEVRPEFVRRAERRARWQQGPTTWVGATAAAVLAVAVVVQLGHHFRDGLAAQSPTLRPLLTAWCGLAGCAIAPPRALQDIVLESSELRAGPTPDTFALLVVLRSRSALALALPSIDLSLTDSAGRLVARRVLSPRDFSAPSVIAPRSEAALQLALSTATPTVVGYTVEIFYP